MRFEKLSRLHATEDFECGEAALNTFLHRFAFASQSSDSAVTYVACDGAEIIGFYTLVAGSVEYGVAPERLKKGLPRHPIPVLVLARLGISLGRKGQGLGKWLLKDAIKRTLAAADIAGIRALMVHAKNEEVAAFYAGFGFVPSEADALHYYVLMKALRQLV